LTSLTTLLAIMKYMSKLRPKNAAVKNIDIDIDTADFWVRNIDIV